MKISFKTHRVLESQIQSSERMERIFIAMREFCDKNNIKYFQIHDEICYEPLPEQVEALMKELNTVSGREFSEN